MLAVLTMSSQWLSKFYLTILPNVIVAVSLQDVEVDRTINKKLEAYYMQLPKSLDDVPKPEEDEPGLRKMALKLRPYVRFWLSLRLSPT